MCISVGCPERVGPAPAREECVLFGLILGTAHGAPQQRVKRGAPQVCFSKLTGKALLCPASVLEGGVCLPHHGQVVSRATKPLPSLTCSHSLVRDLQEAAGTAGWGFRSLANTVVHCFLQARALG